MPTASEAEQFKFLIACIRNSNNGRVDFTEVAKECGIVSKGAAAKRYERLMKANGIAPNAATVRAITPVPSNGVKRDHSQVETGAAKDAARLTIKYHAKEAAKKAANKRLKTAAFATDKGFEDDYEDTRYLTLPDVKPEELGIADYLKSEDDAEGNGVISRVNSNDAATADGAHAIQSVLESDNHGHHSYGLYDNMGSFDGADDIYNAWDKLELVDNINADGQTDNLCTAAQYELPSLNEHGDYQGIVIHN